ncbi:MAG: energy transducer TonB [Alteromonadaceae bacterium]|uniref:energy transducer TonB n=1 Tax=Marinobacter sp. TaxID=50741 RepID=UPI0029C35C09|nr:energy transducer TonB [Marinobacter sp.]MDX5386082.1 energy transducer TonB [Marinobacter sp.]MDX5442028.1 energy transducer TonB [Alteromonadaceae bacterium]MDX5471599.1 energy transducer TonB [Marinobacter sp.]
MTTAGRGPKALILTAAIVATLATLALMAPDNPMELPVLGDSAVNTAPAIRISLAGRQSPEPQQEPVAEPEPTPEPEPEPEPEPAPEPEPVAEPVSEPSTPAPTDSAAVEEAGEEADADNNQDAIPLQNAGNSSDVDSYLSKLSRHLARYYEYPRRARRLGQEGTPVIVFEFARDGSLVSHSLRDSSGHQLLDDSAMQMLAQAAPLPKVPDTMRGQTFTYALPVRFSLR